MHIIIIITIIYVYKHTKDSLKGMMIGDDNSITLINITRLQPKFWARKNFCWFINNLGYFVFAVPKLCAMEVLFACRGCQVLEKC